MTPDIWFLLFANIHHVRQNFGRLNMIMYGNFMIIVKPCFYASFCYFCLLNLISLFLYIGLLWNILETNWEVLPLTKLKNHVCCRIFDCSITLWGVYFHNVTRNDLSNIHINLETYNIA